MKVVLDKNKSKTCRRRNMIPESTNMGVGEDTYMRK